MKKICFFFLKKIASNLFTIKIKQQNQRKEKGVTLIEISFKKKKLAKISKENNDFDSLCFLFKTNIVRYLCRKYFILLSKKSTSF